MSDHDYMPSANPDDRGDCAVCGNSQAAHPDTPADGEALTEINDIISKVGDEIDAIFANGRMTGGPRPAEPAQAAQAAQVKLPPLMACLQRWRDEDHEDAIMLTRDDVINLIEETRAALIAAAQEGRE